MRFLILQENGRHEANRHFRECFSLQRALNRLGEVSCDVWGPGHAAPVPDFSAYDVIVNLENYDSGWVPDLSAHPRPYKVLWSIDAHCRGMAPYRREFERGRYQLILQATRSFVDRDSVWFPNAWDADLIRPLARPKEWDVGFCGSLLDRKPYLDLLRRHFRFRQDLGVLGQAMVEAVNSYRVHFNKNLKGDLNYRSFETLGCGVALLTSYDPAYLDLGFEDGVNCVFWRSRRDLVVKARWLLENHQEVARRGLELAARHSYDRRAEQLVSMILNPLTHPTSRSEHVPRQQ